MVNSSNTAPGAAYRYGLRIMNKTRGLKTGLQSIAVIPAVFLLVLLPAAVHNGTPAEARQETPGAPAIVELGRLLFWDPILSGNRDIACATCHHPDFAYADGRELSLGTGSVGLGPQRTDTTGGAIPVVRRNSPTILNTVFNGSGGRGRRLTTPSLASVTQRNAPMLWDNRVRSLDLQALEPLKAFEEMRGTAYPEEAALDTVAARLREIPEYVSLFHAAFGPDADITPTRIGESIAAFERTLVATNSPFDRFRAGDRSAMTAQQQRGMQAFQNAGCDRCHGGAMFSDFRLHAEGVAEHPLVSTADSGGGQFRFRTPTLRNIALTAPYMHNGTLATLDDVLKFYDEGRSQNPNLVAGARGRGRSPGGRATLDRDFERVRDMSTGQMEDIIAFLEALTDTEFDRTIPPRVPSGLQPGGAISDAFVR